MYKLYSLVFLLIASSYSFASSLILEKGKDIAFYGAQVITFKANHHSINTFNIQRSNLANGKYTLNLSDTHNISYVNVCLWKRGMMGRKCYNTQKGLGAPPAIMVGSNLSLLEPKQVFPARN